MTLGLLLYPQTHACWHAVAPQLTGAFTVVVPDLRGYGDSGCPASDPEHKARNVHVYRIIRQFFDEIALPVPLETFGIERIEHRLNGRVWHLTHPIHHRCGQFRPNALKRRFAIFLIPVVA